MRTTSIHIPVLLLLLVHCSTEDQRKKNDDLTTILSYDPVVQTKFKFFSEHVKDSFDIFISLPKNHEDSEKMYPVVYILDANIAFEMISVLMKLYSVGIECREAIYVGIGYKDIIEMDSLRGRDYTYPAEPEFPETGGGVNFRQFLKNELIPSIDSLYKTLEEEKTIIGHSASGYYVLFELLSGALENNLTFNNYIAGSPFVGNDQFFIDLEKQVSEKTDSLPAKLFMCSGTIDDTDSMQVEFASILDKRRYKAFEYESVILEDFDHMDALVPTWSKGLRYILSY